MSVQVVLDDAIGSAVSDPEELVRRNEMRVGQRPHTRCPHVEKLAVLVENLNPTVPAIHNEDTTIVANRDAVHGIPFIGTRVGGILRSFAPVQQELAVLIELCHALPAVAIADEESAVGEPRNIGWPVEQLAPV